MRNFEVFKSVKGVTNTNPPPFPLKKRKPWKSCQTVDPTGSVSGNALSLPTAELKSGTNESVSFPFIEILTLKFVKSKVK